jgi:hypothetical protein
MTTLSPSIRQFVNEMPNECPSQIDDETSFPFERAENQNIPGIFPQKQKFPHSLSQKFCSLRKVFFLILNLENFQHF